MTEEKYYGWDTAIKIISLIGVAISFFYGIHKYETIKRDDSAKAFWEKQFPIYAQICESASIIATTTDSIKLKKADENFWALYYGKGRIVIDRRVHAKISVFGSKLMSYQTGLLNQIDLQPYVYELSAACKQSLSESWDNPQINFSKENNKY